MKDEKNIMRPMSCQEQECVNGGTVEQNLLNIVIDAIKGVFILKV